MNFKQTNQASKPAKIGFQNEVFCVLSALKSVTIAQKDHNLLKVMDTRQRNYKFSRPQSLVEVLNAFVSEQKQSKRENKTYFLRQKQKVEKM